MPWGILSTTGDIMMHVGEYHEYQGVFSSSVEECNLLLFEYKHGTEHPNSAYDIPPHVSRYPLWY